MSGMVLQVRFSPEDSWGTIRTSEGEGEQKDYKYLQAEQHSWFQNGPPEYRSAEYRIGYVNYLDRNGSKYAIIPFEIYDPTKQKVLQ